MGRGGGSKRGKTGRTVARRFERRVQSAEEGNRFDGGTENAISRLRAHSSCQEDVAATRTRRTGQRPGGAVLAVLAAGRTVAGQGGETARGRAAPLSGSAR